MEYVILDHYSVFLERLDMIYVYNIIIMKHTGNLITYQSSFQFYISGVNRFFIFNTQSIRAGISTKTRLLKKLADGIPISTGPKLK